MCDVNLDRRLLTLKVSIKVHLPMHGYDESDAPNKLLNQMRTDFRCK